MVVLSGEAFEAVHTVHDQKAPEQNAAGLSWYMCAGERRRWERWLERAGKSCTLFDRPACQYSSVPMLVEKVTL